MSRPVFRASIAASLAAGALSLVSFHTQVRGEGASTPILSEPAAAPVRGPLRIVRALPEGTASPNAQILVTFDRPVAGSLDRTVDPKSVLRIEPAAQGRLEWRDPVTVTFTPTTPLASGGEYRVGVDTTFRAMDGEALARPYQFSFRVSGPILLGGSPVSSGRNPTDVRPNTKFELVWSAPVTGEAVAAATTIRFGGSCSGRESVRLRSLGVRELRTGDDWQLREAGGHRRDHSADSLRRVVSLAPVTPLPLDCPAELVAPTELDAARSQGMTAWAFRTYGPLALIEASCASGRECPTGPVTLRFSNAVRGSELRKRVTLLPATPFTMSDTSRESHVWQLDAELKPRSRYAVIVDTSLRDIFGQKFTGNPAAGVATTGYEPGVSYPHGRLLVEREAFGTLAVRHVNVDTLLVTAAPVPDSLEGEFLRNSVWSWGSLWQKVVPGATTLRVPVRNEVDRQTVTGVKLPSTGAFGRRGLLAVRIDGRTAGPPRTQNTNETPNIALVQVTNLAVHAKIGAASGVVWVTRASDGAAVAGARVTVLDANGRALATGSSDARGIAEFPRLVRSARASEDGDGGGGDGYVSAVLGDDRALVGVSQYDPDLSPWQFGAEAAWGTTRLPLAALVFTERGIYRPGEPLYAKAIVRRGALGALSSTAPGDSVRWRFIDREGSSIRDTVVRLSSFGTASHTMALPRDLKLGWYSVGLEYHWNGKWEHVAGTSYRVAEYRPPEFLVDVNGPRAPMLAGDTLRASVEARYLFGAPMARAVTEWSARSAPIHSWELEIPGLDFGSWYVGQSGWWWEDEESGDGTNTLASGVDTLDAAGRTTLRVPLPAATKGRAARVMLVASVTDVNRQVVGGQSTVTVHPADFYIAAKPAGDSYFWRAGTSQSVSVIAVRPSGERVNGVSVRGFIVRREWHQVHRERDGAAEVVGEWVSDTVARCTVRTSGTEGRCDFTPQEGGSYLVSLEATDAKGRPATTSFYRWASGKDWVPWQDETRFKMDVIADKQRYSVGDTATVMLASPFTDAEAWITVEREGLLEQRRMRLTSGSTMLKFPITEAFVPNAYVSVLVVRGRSAPPGRLDDPGRPSMRVGYAELRVTPEVKRLAVAVTPAAKEYLPGDSARIRLKVTDARGTGRRAEVTLWAVDEGVLALTGYRTPDPIDLLYQPRGLGMRLASNLVSVAPQIPEGEKGRRAPGGGGGADAADVLRSQFRSTAFFLGAVMTDANGETVATAKLPDNLTTFRVMAVAATQGDRVGSGEARMLVTRALVARPALPRFLRPGDEFTAGAVVNRRTGPSAPVTVRATGAGVELRGSAEQRVTLEPGRGAEIRFPFQAQTTDAGDRGDSASMSFVATSGGDTDGVRTRIPFRPDYHPRSYTTSGTLRDSATVELFVPAGIDPARSRVTVSTGGSVMALVRGAYEQLRVYPWYCTEQVVSAARPVLALYGATKGATAMAPPDAKRSLDRAVEILVERQRGDGGIGYWGAEQWTTPWLSSYAGLFLLDARAAGITVSDSAIARLTEYVRRAIQAPAAENGPASFWYASRATMLAERVAVADFLGRVGKRDVALENQLVTLAPQMRWEDRSRLAEVLARRGATRPAATLLASQWAAVQIEGRRAVLPSTIDDSTFYFESTVRPAARLLMATLAVAPQHPLVGPLVENVVQQGRAASRWNTQDWAMAVEALSAFERTQRPATAGNVRIRSGRRTLLELPAAAPGGRDSSFSIEGMLTSAADGQQALRLSLDLTGGAAGSTAYYYVTLREVPQRRPVRPDDHGIRVERWYERYDTRAPATSVAEGELVRVRLRITVPADRDFVVLDDPLPAGLEAVDLSLRTAAPLPGPGRDMGQRSMEEEEAEEQEFQDIEWGYGRWDAGWWTPFDYRELRDERVVYFATRLWKGTYTATYVARATTPGEFIRPPAHAEEMYNPAVFGRSDGGVFTVTKKAK